MRYLPFNGEYDDLGSRKLLLLQFSGKRKHVFEEFWYFQSVKKSVVYKTLLLFWYDETEESLSHSMKEKIFFLNFKVFSFSSLPTNIISKTERKEKWNAWKWKCFCRATISFLSRFNSIFSYKFCICENAFFFFLSLNTKISFNVFFSFVPPSYVISGHLLFNFIRKFLEESCWIPYNCN